MNVTRLRAGLDAISYHDRLANNWERRYQKTSFQARLVALAECLDSEDLSGTGASHGRLRFQHIETIARLPRDSNSADGILCSSVLEYVPDPEACLTEFARVLRPGGILVVSVPSAHSVIRRAQITCNRVGQILGANWITYLSYSKNQYLHQEFERVLDSRGFCLERAVPLGGPLPRWMQRTHTWGPLLMFSARKL